MPRIMCKSGMRMGHHRTNTGLHNVKMHPIMVSAEKVRHRGLGNNLVTGVSCPGDILSCRDPIPSSGHQLCVACQSKPASEHAVTSVNHPGFVKHHQSLVNSDINIVQKVNHGQEQSNQFPFIVWIFTELYKIGLMKI